LKVKYFDLNAGSDQYSGYSNNLKFGISAGIFFDTGMVWYNRSQVGLQNLDSGFGAGLHFHLPYIDLLRVEYGFDTDYKGELILDLEKSF
jgi:hypothetical protein